MRPSTRSGSSAGPAADGGPAADVVLVFDLDGTLLDGREAIVGAVQEGLESTYRHFRLPPAADRHRIAGAIGLPAARYFRTAFDPDTVPAELREEFAVEFEARSTRAEVAALERGAAALYAGMREVLLALAARGHPLALYSNANAAYFAAVVRVHGLAEIFARALSLEEAARAGLARDKAGLVRHLRAAHPQAVVLGDRVHDVEAGRAAGARTVGCLYGFGSADELAAADWRVGAPGEILDLPLGRPA